MDEKDRRIEQLELQVLDLATKISQFSKLFAHTALKNDPDMDKDIKVKLKKVITGEAMVKSWSLEKDCPIQPIFVDK